MEPPPSWDTLHGIPPSQHPLHGTLHLHSTPFHGTPYGRHPPVDIQTPLKTLPSRGNSFLFSTGELPKTNDSTFDNHTVRVEILVSASRDASASDTLPWTLSVDTSGTDSSAETIPTDTLNAVAATTPTTAVRTSCKLIFKRYFILLNKKSNEHTMDNGKNKTKSTD